MFRNNTKLAVLRAFSAFFRELSFSSSLTFADAFECVCGFCEKSSFGMLTFINELSVNYEYGCDFRKLWRDSLENSSELRYLEKTQRSVLLSFADVFGKSSKDEFSKKCMQYSVLFREYYDEEKKKSEKNKALAAASGLLTGAAVFIIFV